jgi:hypothetical protein
MWKKRERKDEKKEGRKEGKKEGRRLRYNSVVEYLPTNHKALAFIPSITRK